MIKLIKHMMLIAVFGAAIPNVTFADPVRIVDTGPSGPVGNINVDWNTQWVAAEFSTVDTWRITSVEGWMVPFGHPRVGGPLRISLLGDGGNIPSVPLFSTTTQIPGIGPAEWYGRSGLAWQIPPGSYWLSFEALAETTFVMSGATPAPLANGASAMLSSDCDFRDRSCWPWSPQRDIDLGVRISAQSVAPVPEPMSLVLVGAGMLGLVARKLRSAQDHEVSAHPADGPSQNQTTSSRLPVPARRSPPLP